MAESFAYAFSTFSLSCGLPELKQAISLRLVALGYLSQTEAKVTLIVDVPTGYALHKLENLKGGEKTVVMTSSVCVEYWEALWNLRPHVLLVGQVNDQELRAAMEYAARGERYRVAPPDATPLSPSELRVLSFLARGLPNKAIAEKLNVQEKTVMNTLTVIYQKLGMENRVEAVLYYWGIREIFNSNQL